MKPEQGPSENEPFGCINASDTDRDADAEKKQTIELVYNRPSFYNDGSGSIIIKTEDKEEKIDLYNRHFKEEDIGEIKYLLECASNNERLAIIDKVKRAISQTEMGKHVSVEGI